MLLNDSDEKDRWFRFDDVFVCMRWRLKDGYKNCYGSKEIFSYMVYLI